jgi:adenine specific DNA methylase Mod
VYVHLDYNVGHYAKVVMDEVFGPECFVNSITWKRSDAHSDVGQGAKHLGRISDTILYYTRSPSGQTLNMQFAPLSQQTRRPLVLAVMSEERKLRELGSQSR